MVDLGEVINIDRVDIKNTHAGHHNKRSTKKFIIWSQQETAQSWTKILTNELESAIDKVCKPVYLYSSISYDN